MCVCRDDANNDVSVDKGIKVNCNLRCDLCISRPHFNCKFSIRHIHSHTHYDIFSIDNNITFIHVSLL